MFYCPYFEYEGKINITFRAKIYIFETNNSHFWGRKFGLDPHLEVQDSYKYACIFALKVHIFHPILHILFEHILT
jgi:hypothetical protein